VKQQFTIDVTISLELEFDDDILVDYLWLLGSDPRVAAERLARRLIERPLPTSVSDIGDLREAGISAEATWVEVNTIYPDPLITDEFRVEVAMAVQELGFDDLADKVDAMNDDDAEQMRRAFDDDARRAAASVIAENRKDT